MVRTRSFDNLLAKTLNTPQDMAAYLDPTLAEGSEEDFLLALKDVAGLIGMSKLARDAELGRESMYKMLSESGNPKLDSLMAVLHALGLRLSVRPKENSVDAA
jgi:probable addiction module antidote protein